MVVGRANSEGDINVDSEEDLETSELSKIVTHSESTTRSSPYRVSVQGVESLWGDCRFIPADWGS